MAKAGIIPSFKMVRASVLFAGALRYALRHEGRRCQPLSPSPPACLAWLRLEGPRAFGRPRPIGRKEPTRPTTRARRPTILIIS